VRLVTSVSSVPQNQDQQLQLKAVRFAHLVTTVSKVPLLESHVRLVPTVTAKAMVNLISASLAQ